MNKAELVRHINSVLKDVLPHVPKLPSELTAVFEDFYERNKDEESVVALLCIIAEIPGKISNAPYILDSVIIELENGKNEYSDSLTLYLLNIKFSHCHALFLTISTVRLLTY